MGTDREARALAAGDVVEVDGKEFTLRPIRIQRLCDLERAALRYHKRQVLETYRDNLDLLEEKQANGLMERKLEEVSTWGVAELPKRTVYDATNIPVNDKIKEWVNENYPEMKPTKDFVYQMILTLALDTNKITVKKVKSLSGVSPRQGTVRYDQWWVTASYDGMVAFVHSSIKDEHPEMTIEDVGKWAPDKIVIASKKVEQITSASMGNG